MAFKFGNRVGDSGVLELSSNAIIIWSSRVLNGILQLCLFAIIVSLMIGRIAPIRLCTLWRWNKVRSVLRVIPSHYSLLTLCIGWSMSSPIDA